jgi:hypothetical protein
LCIGEQAVDGIAAVCKARKGIEHRFISLRGYLEKYRASPEATPLMRNAAHKPVTQVLPRSPTIRSLPLATHAAPGSLTPAGPGCLQRAWFGTRYSVRQHYREARRLAREREVIRPEDSLIDGPEPDFHGRIYSLHRRAFEKELSSWTSPKFP